MSARALAWSVRAALAIPFVVALVALAGSHWSPVLDLAMTELRVRDVLGPHTPLIGLPGRIGTFPDQGSHPGPLSFYLLAPVYRLLGSTAYGLLVAAAVINVAAAWTAIWVAGRRGGGRLVLGVAAVLMVVMAWLGASVLTQPWNPYLPLVSFVVVVLSAWGVLDGDHLLLVLLVGFSTLCAQTHVPYLALCVALCVVAFGAVGWRWWRSGHRAQGAHIGAGGGCARRGALVARARRSGPPDTRQHHDAAAALPVAARATGGARGRREDRDGSLRHRARGQLVAAAW
ncbi:MAG: hypothetical protein IPP16_10000 [Acidimicrobiaceae bacterium]|nr:hypothetical protein [Acidimicrobiaceae bacterium]